MGQHLDSIIAAARRTRGYADKLLTGVQAADFSKKPRFSGTIVDTNHPAFVYGHLALYPTRIAPMLGVDGADLAAPAGFEELFKAGVPCHDDPDRRLYPAMETIVGAFRTGYDRLFERAAGVNDSVLLAPTPDARYREIFPLAGAAAIFMLNNHVMVHMGQISVWRRCFGLPSAM